MRRTVGRSFVDGAFFFGVALLIGAFLGSGATWIAMRSTSDSTDAHNPIRDSSGNVGRTTSPLDDDAPRTPTPAVTESWETRVPTRESSTPATGHVSGRIYRTDGSALHGATVQIEGRSATPSVTTDDAGRYTLEIPERSSVNLVARAPSYEIVAAAGFARQNVRSGTRVDFIAKRLVEVPVIVVLPDGAPARQADIEITSGSSLDRSTPTRRQVEWTSATPRLRVPIGDHTIRARTADGLRSEACHVQVLDGIPPAEVRIELAATSSIHGFVHVGDQDRNTRFMVSVLSIASDTDVSMLFGEQSHRSRYPVQRLPADDRSFAFEGLEPGNYAILLYRESEVVHAVPVSVSFGIHTVDLVAPPLPRDETLTFYVTDERGDPVDRARFLFQYDIVGRRSGGGMSPVAPQGNGVYIARPGADIRSFLDGESEGYCRVAVSRRDIGGERIDLHPGGPREYYVTLDEYDRVKLGVEFPDLASSDPIQAVRLRLGTVEGSKYPSSHGARFDASGKASIRCNPGSYDLLLELDVRGVRSPVPFHHEVVQLMPGNPTLRLGFPDLVPLTILLDEADAGRLQMNAMDIPGRFTSFASIDTPGTRIVLDALPRGSYRFIIGARDLIVDLDAAKEVRFPSSRD